MAYIGVQPTSIPLTSSDITDGIISTAKIADNAVTSAKIPASAGIDGSKLGTGAVLQVKHFQLTTSQTTTYANTNTDIVIPNFNINITPSSTSSVIKLEANIMFESANEMQDTMWFIYRDTTKLGNTQSSPGSRIIGISPTLLSYWAQNNDSTPEFTTITYFDTPQTTSQINYKLGVNANGTSNIFINRMIADIDNASNDRGVSFISATEIGG